MMRRLELLRVNDPLGDLEGSNPSLANINLQSPFLMLLNLHDAITRVTSYRI